MRLSSGLLDGLPIGLQLSGRLHSDVQLFQAAYFFVSLRCRSDCSSSCRLELK